MKAYFPSRQPASGDYFTKLAAFETVAGGAGVACVRCGYDILDALHLDHKENDGVHHRRSQGAGGSGAGMRTYRWVCQFPDEARKRLQILCANCHQIKTSIGYLPTEPPMTKEQITFLARESWELDCED